MYLGLILILAAIVCPPLSSITNGAIAYSNPGTPNYPLGTIATYSCDAGYVLDLTSGGSETRTCIDDGDNDAEGVFSGQAPACIGKSALINVIVSNS